MKKNKKHGPMSDLHKHTIKHKRKSLTNTNRTEILDKKLEARRKRRAKRKVHVVICHQITDFYFLEYGKPCDFM